MAAKGSDTHPEAKGWATTGSGSDPAATKKTTEISVHFAKGRMMNLRDALRNVVRKIAYSRAFEPAVAAVKQWSSRDRSEAEEANLWDELLEGNLKPYIAETSSTWLHARIVATVGRTISPESRRLLDIGCGAGLLAETSADCGFTDYTGVDISEVALDAARKRMEARRHRYPKACRFDQGALGSFALPDDATAVPFDLIIFSEVLYYMDTATQAVAEVQRLCRWLGSDGHVGVFLKDDGKSAAILRKLRSEMSFKYSMIVQEQGDPPVFRVRIDRGSPACICAFFQPLPEE